MVVVLIFLCYVMGQDVSGFPVSITFLLFCSIFPPLLASALTTAWRRPTIALGHGAWQTFQDSPPTCWGVSGLSVLRVLTVVCYIVVPAVVVNMRELAKTRKEKVLMKIKKQLEENQEGDVSSDHLSEVQELDEYLKEARQGILSFKRGELAVEVPVQLCLLVTMLLLTFSTTVTNSGLQTFLPRQSWQMPWSIDCDSELEEEKEESK